MPYGRVVLVAEDEAEHRVAIGSSVHSGASCCKSCSTSTAATTASAPPLWASAPLLRESGHARGHARAPTTWAPRTRPSIRCANQSFPPTALKPFSRILFFPPFARLVLVLHNGELAIFWSGGYNIGNMHDAVFSLVSVFSLTTICSCDRRQCHTIFSRV